MAARVWVFTQREGLLFRTVPVTDEEAVEAFVTLSRREGIIPALESAHALAYLQHLAPQYGPEDLVIVNLSGRGDKDVETAARWFGLLGDPGAS